MTIKLDPMPKTWPEAVRTFRRWRLEAAAARIASTHGVKVVPWVRPQECAATGAGHHDGPYGPRGQTQCHDCGEKPIAGLPAVDSQTNPPADGGGE